MITIIIVMTKNHNYQQVAQVRGGNGLDWVAVDAKEMPEELARKEKNKGGGGVSRWCLGCLDGILRCLDGVWGCINTKSIWKRLY